MFFLLVSGCSTQYRLAASHYQGFEGEINQHSRLIQAPAETLFDIVTDEERFKAVLPEGTVLTQETPPPYQPGTVVRINVNHIFKLTWQSQVKEVIPAKKIRLTFLNGFFAGGTELWEFVAEEGGTRTTHTIIVDPQGLGRKIAWNLKARLKHDRMVEQMLDNLKRIAEARP
jgi:uncharacterized protein YndB with AHSA1/START domain